MAKPVRLSAEAAGELLRLAIEHVVMSVWPNMDARRAARQALVIETAVLQHLIDQADQNPVNAEERRTPDGR